MKPTYSNFFMLTTNQTNGEVVLNFKHTYPETVEENGQAIYKGNTEDVASLVLTNYDAHKLLELLTNSLYPNEK